MQATALQNQESTGGFAAEARTGRIIGRTVEGYPVVDFDGNTTGPKPARTTLLTREVAKWPAETPVLLVFENSDPDLPIIIGRLLSAHLEVALPSKKQSIVLEAQQEIVLRCGHSSLTLQHDGKIILRGRDLISRASRRNRIQGGSVSIN